METPINAIAVTKELVKRLEFADQKVQLHRVHWYGEAVEFPHRIGPVDVDWGFGVDEDRLALQIRFRKGSLYQMVIESQQDIQRVAHTLLAAVAKESSNMENRTQQLKLESRSSRKFQAIAQQLRATISPINPNECTVGDCTILRKPNSSDKLYLVVPLTFPELSRFLKEFRGLDLQEPEMPYKIR